MTKPRGNATRPSDDAGNDASSRVIRPYGDATGDGMVQVSFTLPIPHDKRAEGAAAQLARKMGIDPALVVHAKPMGPDFTFFVVYGPVHHLVEPHKVVVLEREFPLRRLALRQARRSSFRTGFAASRAACA